MNTYVYGIARNSPELESASRTGGVGDPPRPVRLLGRGRLAALVSDAPEDLRPKRRDLLAHQHVLTEASAAGTVLPLRFGGVSADDETVATALADREEHYLERLDAVDGKAEYNVKAHHDEEAVLHRVLADDPDLRAMGAAQQAAGGTSQEEKLRLGELIAAAVRRREELDRDEVHRALKDTAVASVPGPESSGWVANLSYLVEQERAEEFVTAAARFQRVNPHLRIQVNGPLPPYSFVG
ncbi:GvpL/GvpF family gas vesicle protein [Streptomyces peucetius]|uniref:GvpL/GvpF family gas vesicle protein n=1 Tax=Streptomyces peucetius TaxID=1950 RepID=A0ABY6I2M8_STRPE|nr:GvpL/GvpF family gas vesicle protein [Streptomyces peucetius]UYQ60262.1 GvpL/GvpF family gas vesicle protein [Streptomyces peucetius]